MKKVENIRKILNVSLSTTCANSKATAEDAVAEIQNRIDAVNDIKADLQTVSKSLSKEPTPDFTYDCVDEKYLAEIRDQVKNASGNFSSSSGTSKTAVNLRKDVDAAYCNFNGTDSSCRRSL